MFIVRVTTGSRPDLNQKKLHKVREETGKPTDLGDTLGTESQVNIEKSGRYKVKANTGHGGVFLCLISYVVYNSCDLSVVTRPFCYL